MRRPEPQSVVAALLLSGCSCTASLPGRKGLRPAEHAGIWYERDPDKLARRLDELLAGVQPLGEPALALVVPHAGLEWSGSVAARTWGLMRARAPRRVVLLAPSHDATFEGVALPAEGGFETPLGPALIDEEAVSLLAGYPGFARRAAAFDGEHAIEVQLPFVRHLFPLAQVVPLLVGRCGAEELARAGRTLRNILDEDSLLVASTSLTHFGSDFGGIPVELSGTREQIEERLFEHDRTGLAALLERDAAGLRASPQAKGICGLDALTVLLAALGPGAAGRMAAQGSTLPTSFDPASPTGVTYAGVVFPGRWPSIPVLDDADRLGLSELAHRTVAAVVEGSDPPALEKISPRLSKRGAAFVTLTKRGMLRGCMGRLDADSVALAVSLAARMAPRSDPRFPPMSAAELGEVELEVSVLGPFVALEDPMDFEPGRHGLLLSRGLHRGLLLPQVASRYGMGREEFLEALAEKAGLEPGEWRGATVQRFGVEAFEIAHG